MLLLLKSEMPSIVKLRDQRRMAWSGRNSKGYAGVAGPGK
jgi:hypothetical protein